MDQQHSKSCRNCHWSITNTNGSAGCLKCNGMTLEYDVKFIKSAISNNSCEHFITYEQAKLRHENNS